MSEFRPLTLDRIPPARPERAEPRSWYEVIAERFPAEGPAPIADEPDEPGEGPETVSSGGRPRRAQFNSIEEIAHSAARRRRAGAPVPPDIQRARDEAKAEARRILTEARQEARRVLEESREEGRRAGYEAGFAAGERSAREQVTERAAADRAACIADLTDFIATTEATSRRAWADMEPELMALVFEIARKVIKMEVEMNRAAAIEIVKNTLRRVADSTSMRIRVHADDLQTVRANREELFSLVDGVRKVEIVEDRRVGTGGCIVETNAGTIDARIETQLEEIRKLLMGGESGGPA
ncbi:MAG TPA: FliH/SctL family protein [Chthonomonadaceae bacterium]|nr:FliH/SctL family protein [Chthonomonadaceae bacterium]